ncbi:glycerophosphodiester phosphodiesterase family protein [Cerasicoccus frondis]|uniref:glycerophosphodiester phosphodiesterase family protein n=1 Tax=Cerasicoccus frondis TaxID=490090 RepID=UPI002852C03B|nr:glycerophosphodiester phosphodiesterase family protein [Cerasicoccus frondis]
MRLLLVFLCTLSLQHALAETLVVAHRGASHDAPENTLAAFNLAWEQGADAIEADFRLTMDGRLICIHDESTSDVSNEIRNVDETEWARLREMDVGSWKGKRFANERMPSLAEVLATVPAGKLAYIELKGDYHIVDPFLVELAETDFPIEQLRVIAFDRRVLYRIKTKQPEIQTMLLISFQFSTAGYHPRLEAAAEQAKGIKADAISMNLKGPLTPDSIRWLNDQGLRVHAWTIDHAGVSQTLADFGVDSITTNRPYDIKTALRK